VVKLLFAEYFREQALYHILSGHYRIIKESDAGFNKVWDDIDGKLTRLVEKYTKGQKDFTVMPNSLINVQEYLEK
jgi:hypothetical protein